MAMKLDYSSIFIAILLGIVVFGVIYAYQDSKMSHIDLMQSGSGHNVHGESSSDEEHAATPTTTAAPPTKSSGYTAQQTASPSELLPNDANSQWASLNPVNQTNNPQMPDLLQAGYHIGLDTIGQSLKNSNLQLRSDPIIPQMETGPWNKSTIEPDMTRNALDFSGI